MAKAKDPDARAGADPLAHCNPARREFLAASGTTLGAALGAAALGDIGKHFPDTDPAFEGADSRVLLRHVLGLVKANGWQVGNVDATIVAQAPKMAPHIDAMRALIAADLEVQLDQVNVKATTTEKLGFTGREEGIAVHAVALLCAR